MTASSSEFCRTVSLHPWHQESHGLGWVMPCSLSHFHLKHDPVQTYPGMDISVRFVTPLGCTKPHGSWWLLSPGVWGACVMPPAAEAAAVAPGAAARQPRSSRCPGRVGVGMNNDCAAAPGSSTTDSPHRNYSRHKENTNKDRTQQRGAGISQQKRRIETLKAAFISLCSSVHEQSNSRNVRAWGTLQVTRISLFIAYFLYKLTTNTGVLVLFALFGNSETEWDLFSSSPSPLKGCSNEQRM